ncbi:MAG: S8 family peptidase [Candidatus Aminicenantes bacterium]|nr:S8 family peptidase [Candidatus Aminicenantes bacterium]
MKKQNSNEPEVIKCQTKAVGENTPGSHDVERVLMTASEVTDWGLKMLSIPSWWKETRGEGIKVAILDTGVAYNHPDLSHAVTAMEDFTGSKCGPADMDGHGTHVAGIIAARKNRQGVVGIAPKAKLLIGKVLGDNGVGSFKALAKGIYWAIEQNADIISLSLQNAGENEAVHDAIKEAIKNDIFVICAAGNKGPQIDSVKYPAKYPETIAVGAIDRRLKVAHYSSRGDQVDIVAPGEEILSTYPPKIYAVLSGTSMAAPFVSGIAALLIAKHRKLGGETPIKTQADLLEHLRRTAIDIGSAGLDPLSGFGLINPEDLLEYEEDLRLPEFMEPIISATQGWRMTF